MELWLLATVVSASCHPEAVQQNCGFLHHLWHSVAYQMVSVDTLQLSLQQMVLLYF